MSTFKEMLRWYIKVRSCSCSHEKMKMEFYHRYVEIGLQASESKINLLTKREKSQFLPILSRLQQFVEKIKEDMTDGPLVHQ